MAKVVITFEDKKEAIFTDIDDSEAKEIIEKLLSRYCSNNHTYKNNDKFENSTK